MDNLHAWLRLWHIPSIGPKSFNFLLGKFPQIADLFTATVRELERQGVPPRIISEIKAVPADSGRGQINISF